MRRLRCLLMEIVIQSTCNFLIMKTCFKNITLVLLVLLGNFAFSQEISNEDKAIEMTQNMQEQIGFSDEAYAKVYDVNLEFVNKTQELKQRDVSKFKKFKALKKMDDKRNKDLKDVLTKAEYELFEKNKSDNRKAFKDRLKDTRS